MDGFGFFNLLEGNGSSCQQILSNRVFVYLLCFIFPIDASQCFHGI